jgi:outer membrane protein insertion porin family
VCLNSIKNTFTFVFIAFLLAVLFYPGLLSAETQKIKNIEIEGNIRVLSSVISGYIKTKAGDDFDPVALRADLENVYKSGLFVDIKIDKETFADGVIVTFIVLEKPVINEIIFIGNKEVGTESLSEKLTIEENQLLSSEELVNNVTLIKNAYSEKGYYITEIDYEVKEIDEKAVRIIFNIKENSKVYIKKVNFIGNDSFSKKELMAVIETTEGGLFSGLDDSGTFKEDIFDIDIEKIQRFYKEHGYLKVDVKPAKTSLSYDKRELFLTVLINEGKLFRVGKIEIQGEDLIFTKEELGSLIKLKEGDIYNETRLFNDILSLKDKYTNIGYAYANVYPQPVEDLENQKINLIVKIKRNELVYINEINVTGNKSTRDKIIRRELKIHEGELYNRENIIKSRENLFYLGYFEEVNLLTKKSADDKMNLEINVKGKSTGSLNIGAGYSSHDKAMGFASISKGNWRGLGQTIKLETQMSDKRQTFDVSFLEPWLFDIPLSFWINIYNSRKQYTDYLKKSTGGSFKLGYPLFEKVRGYVKYKYEEVEITDIEPGVSSIIADQEGFTITSSLELTFQRDTRDNRLDPTKGSLSSVYIEYAGGPLAGDNYYTKYRLKASKYMNPWSDHIFMAHSRISYAHGNEGRDLPVYERYYLGGINSLRGFDYSSVGPKDPVTGDVIGGDKEILFNLEYTFYLKKEANFKLVLFYDAGNAFEESEDIELSKLRHSMGYGIRWVTPMGPLRLEWGYNIDPEPGEAKSQWEFTIGSFF